MSSSVQARNRFERMSKPKRVLWLLIALAVVVVALTAVAEGAVRLRQWIRFGSIQDVFYVYYVDRNLGTWFPKPNLDIILARRSHITINSAGFRSPEIQLTPPTPHTIRLAFLGGSTTFCAEDSRNETTWPYLVAEKMQQHYPKVKIEFINAAASGYLMHDSLISFENKVRPYHPDIVFIYDAHNDLNLESHKVALQRHLTDKPWSNFGSPENDEEKESVLMRDSMLLSLVKKNILYYMAQTEGENPDYKMTVDFDKLSIPYEQRVRDLAARIRDAGAIPVLVTFSPRVRPEQTPEQKLEATRHAFIFMPYYTPESLLQGYVAFNNAMRRIAADSSAELVGDEYAIPADKDHYTDDVHFTDAGSAAMADRVTRIIFQDSVINRLISSREAEKSS